MELGLKDKVALVTGASRGIGRSIAAGLAKEGCKTAISARSERELDRAAQEMRDTGATVHAIQADVTKSGDAKRVVEETVKTFGTIHIVVNNVGGAGRFAPFEELTDEEWLDAFNLNVLSAVRVTRAALPWMKNQKWGRIINISSESGTQPDAFMPHYNAAKGALNTFTKSLSKAYGKDGILVNTVSPAFIRTPLLEEFMAKQAREMGVSVQDVIQQFLRENRANIVLGRPGEPDETAGIVVFLASEAAAFITGSNYRVDGGSVASI